MTVKPTRKSLVSKIKQTFPRNHIFKLMKEQLVTTLTVETGEDSKSTRAYYALMRHQASQTGNLKPKSFTIDESRSTVKNRLIAGDGTFYGKICDTPYILKVNKISKEGVRSATLSMFMVSHDKLIEITEYLSGKADPNPKIYDCSSTGYGSNLTYMGRIHPYYKTERQLISSEIYDQIDQVFDRFSNDKESYKNRGNRREVMWMFGPPGTGKTSMVRHMCAKYGLPVIKATPETLKRVVQLIAIRTETQPYVISIEEIEETAELCIETGELSRHSRRADVYSDFINTLDGLHPLNNIMVCMSSNHPERLKPAVYRKGRVNHHIEMNVANLEVVLDVSCAPDEVEKRAYLAEHLQGLDVNAGFIGLLKEAKTITDVEVVIKSLKEYIPMIKQFEINGYSNIEG